MVCAVKGKVYIEHYAFIINGTYVRVHLIYSVLLTRNNENCVQQSIQTVGEADIFLWKLDLYSSQYRSLSIALYFFFFIFLEWFLLPSASVSVFCSSFSLYLQLHLSFTLSISLTTCVLASLLSSFSFPFLTSFLASATWISAYFTNNVINCVETVFVNA